MTDKKEETPIYKDYKKLMEEVATLSKSETNPFFKSGYVPLRTVLEEAKAVCLRNNFIFIQSPYVLDGKPALKTNLIHASGEKMVAIMPLVTKDPDDPQKLGASMTYMRRYSLISLLGIQEADDDGALASGNTTNKDNKINEPF